MTSTLAHARAAAIIETLQRTEWQASTLEDRIMNADVRGNHAEYERLCALRDSCNESAGQYRAELETLTSQGTINFGGQQ